MTTQLIAISGSLRKDSFNTRLLEAAQTLAPDDVELTLFRLDEIPLYNADLENEPAAVSELKHHIQKSHGVLISTPEYNYSVSGVLKNALDWASRPAYRSVFARKPVALIGAAASPAGAARAQAHLKQILLGMLSLVYPAPELTVGNASTKFDQGGRLQDDAVRDRLQRLVTEFAKFAQHQAPTTE